MKRWWLLPAIGAVSAVVLLHLSRPDAAPVAPGADRPAGATEAQPLPAVQVEQVIVQADVVRSPEPQVDLAVSFDRPAGMAGGPKGVQRATSLRPTGSGGAKTPSPILERAKRAFLGDGRHRPEPFPRVKDN